MSTVAGFVFAFVAGSTPSWLPVFLHYWPLLSIVYVAGWVTYLVDLTNNPAISGQKRWLWLFALLARWPLAIPVYFCLHVLGSVRRRPQLSSEMR